MISNFSFGLLALFLAYLIPATIMEKKKHRKTAKQAGMAGLAFFLMIVYPSFDDAGNINILFSNLGTGGMIASLIAGLFVSSTCGSPANASLPFNTECPISYTLRSLYSWDLPSFQFCTGR